MLRFAVELRDVHFVAKDGLERSPHLTYRGTWPGARYSRRAVYLEAGPSSSSSSPVALELPLPPGGVVDAGHAIWFSLYAKSRFTMVADIDLKDSAFREPSIEAGDAVVYLKDLLAHGGGGGDLTQIVDTMVLHEIDNKAKLAFANGDTKVFADPVGTLGAAKFQALVEHVERASEKGTLRVRLLNAAALRASDRAPTWPPPYSKEYAALNQRLFHLLEEPYMIHATGMPVADARGLTRWGVSPHDSLVDSLHLLQFQTPVGALPPIAYLMQMASARAGALGAEGVERRYSRAALERGVAFIDRLLGSSLVVNGMAPSDFNAVARRQLARRDETIDARYVSVLTVINFAHCFPANQIHYKSDFAVPNMDYLGSLDPEVQKLYIPADAVVAPTVPTGALDRCCCDSEDIQAAARTLSQHRGRMMLTQRLARPSLSSMLSARASTSARTASSITAAPHVRRATWSASLQAAMPEPRFSAMPTAAAAPDDETTRLVKAPKPVIVGDRWSMTIGSQEQRYDDCEGVGGFVVVNGHLFGDLLDQATTAGIKLPPVVETYRAVMSTMTMHMLGATVTSPYVETSADGTAPATPVHVPLPMIGSAEDKKWEQNGHGLGMMESKARAAGMMLRGLAVNGHLPDDVAADRAELERRLDADGRPWLRNLPVAYCEGTGNVHPFPLPPVTTFKGMLDGDVYARKAEARITFARAIKGHGFGPLDAEPAARTHVAELTTLSDIVRVQAQPYEERELAPGQRAHPFLRTLAHFLSLDAYTHVNPTLAHTLSVDLPTNTRAVTVGDYFMHPERVSLQSYLGPSVSRRQWQAEAEPGIQAALVHLPLASHAGVDETLSPQPDRLAHPLSTAGLMTLAGPSITPATVGVALGACPAFTPSFAQREPDTVAALDRIALADARPDRVTLPLFIDADKIAYLGSQKTAELVSALETLRKDAKIADYAFLHDQPMPLCGDTIHLVLSLPVSAVAQ
jgi:hypothetical protein